MVYTYQPAMMEVNEDTIPELSPIFSVLNSHSNKLYQEGYFLKLDDQNTQGKPNADRTWTECFAQLVGTVLSLWDAAELDAAGEDGEVLPKFLNLTDASIKMIESLPTRSNDEQPLQNILSISTAGRNRYLLHFNSHHSLCQWTAGIRLAMFEQNTLQEAYTGALIAGKGKSVNNINVIMDRARTSTEAWVRVRFGAGVPWRRCWCVVTPPDEKEFNKMQKEMKKRSPYDRTAIPHLKGDIKFYDQKKEGKKQKKLQPIATIQDAYSAYAIYPQAKALVDASTLLKLEGIVTVHSDPPTSNEGFVFIMPEVSPMVSGFEMLLRFLFPIWDTFALYGRPGKLVASILDSRSLMFAMPKHKRYGYLDLLDVTNLISENGSAGWNEQEWRRRLKEATGTRMNAIEDGTRSPQSRSHSRSNSRSSNQLPAGGSPQRPKVGFAEDAPSVRSSRSHSLSQPHQDIQKKAPTTASHLGHVRNSSDPSFPGGSPHHGPSTPYGGSPQRGPNFSPEDSRTGTPLAGMRSLNTPEPVSRPPAFNQANKSDRPISRAYHSPELRRANSRLSVTTLAQLAKAGGLEKDPDTQSPVGQSPVEDFGRPGHPVHPHANPMVTPANDNWSQGPRPAGPNQPPHLAAGLSVSTAQGNTESPMGRSPYASPSPYSAASSSPRPSTSEGRRSPYPPGGPGGPGPNMRPAVGRPSPNPRGPPGQAPPPQEYYARGPPPAGSAPVPRGPMGPPGPGQNYARGPPGPAEFQGQPQHRGLPDRSASLDKHGSITTNDIIEHYTSPDHVRPYKPAARPGTADASRAPPPPMHGGRGYGTPGYNDYAESPDRPRAGVLKTVGGGDGPPPQRNDFGVPDVNFGPTVNYGSAVRANSPLPPNHPAYAQPSRPYSPAGARPGTAGRQSPGPQQMRRPDDVGNRQRPWQPAQGEAQPPPLAPYHQQYMAENNMAPRSAPPSAGRDMGAPAPYGAPGGDMQPSAYGQPPSSFSRPLQPGAQVDPRGPPQGQYSAQGQRPVHPHYQGQAF